MLTTKQIINLARKQEWWNEFDKKRMVSVEKLARYAINANNYEYFMTGAFIFNNDLAWFNRSDAFAKLCKEKEKDGKVESKVSEYDLVVSDEVVARFYTHGKKLTDDDRKQIYTVLRVYNIPYDTMEYDTKEKVLIVYKHSSSWIRR